MLYRKDTARIEEIKSILTEEGLCISDTLIDLLRLFKVQSLCLKNGMIKHKGYSVSEILTVLILFPFMAISTVRSFYLSRFKQLTQAKQDTLFRLKNNERFNWRNLLYLFAKRFKNLTARSTDKKEGTKIEFIGKVFDHVLKGFVLGFKLLLLGYWDGKNLIPLDFSYHSEKGSNKKRVVTRICGLILA